MSNKTIGLCVQSLVDNHGYSQTEARLFVNKLTGDIRGLKKEGLGGKELTQRMATDLADKEYVAKVKLENLASDLIKLDKIQKEFDAVRAENPKVPFKTLMVSKLLGVGEWFVGARDSIEAQQAGLNSMYNGPFIQSLEQISLKAGKDKNFLIKALSREGKDITPDELDFVNEAHTAGSSNNPLMAEAAKEYVALQRELAKHNADEGGLIRSLENRGLKNTHSTVRILKGTDAEWANFINPLLDWDRMAPSLSPVKRVELLTELVSEIKMGGDINSTLSAPGVRSTSIVRNAHRGLHFLNGEAQLIYHKRYGNGTILGSIQNDIKYQTRDLALMKNMGSDPHQMLTRLVDNETIRLAKIKNAAPPDSKVAKEAQKQLDDLRKAYVQGVVPSGELPGMLTLLTGENESPVNVTLSNVGRAVRLATAWSKMGMSGVMTLNDIHTTSNHERAIGIPLNQIIKGVFTDFIPLKDRAKRKAIQNLGFLLHADLGMSMSRFGFLGEPNGRMTKLNNLLYSVNGTTYLSETKKAQYAFRASVFMGENRSKNWNELSGNMQAWLEYHGYRKKDWPFMRQMMVEENGQPYMFIPSAARTFTQEQLMPLTSKHFNDLDADGQAREIRNIRRGLEIKGLAFLADDVGFGVYEPNLKTNYYQTGGGKRSGTWVGEFFKSASQFKSWPITWLEKGFKGQAHLNFSEKRALSRGDKATLGQKTRGAAYSASLSAIRMSSYVARAMVVGAVVLTIKDILNGKSPRDFTKKETLTELFLFSGVGSFFADVATGSLDTKERVSEFILGPSISAAARLVAAGGKAASGDPVSGAKEVGKVAQSYVPGGNMWFAKVALDRVLMNSVSDYLSPGTIRRREKRMKKEFGQSYWYDTKK